MDKQQSRKWSRGGRFLTVSDRSTGKLNFKLFVYILLQNTPCVNSSTNLNPIYKRLSKNTPGFYMPRVLYGCKTTFWKGTSRIKDFKHLIDEIYI